MKMNQLHENHILTDVHENLSHGALVKGTRNGTNSDFVTNKFKEKL